MSRFVKLVGPDEPTVGIPCLVRRSLLSRDADGYPRIGVNDAEQIETCLGRVDEVDVDRPGRVHIHRIEKRNPVLLEVDRIARDHHRVFSGQGADQAIA